MVLLAAGVARWLWSYYFASLPSTLLWFAIPLVFCPFLALVLGLGAVLGHLIIKATSQTRSVIPVVVFVIGIILVFQIPLSDGPTTDEKAHFLAHRADYEAVVELARRNQLAHEDCSYGYRPPEELAHVSTIRCLSVDTFRVFEVQFYPLDKTYYRSVLYTEAGTCPYDSFVKQKIDEYWYVCEEEWN